MKSIQYSIAAVVLVLVAAMSCSKQDDSYKQYIRPGGLKYPAKALDITAETGFNKVTLSWPLPKDPSVFNARIYWDNYTDSLDVDYSQFATETGADTAVVKIAGLSDRSYSFVIVNFDKKGNRSLPAEYTATPYGANWLSAHSERAYTGAYYDAGKKTANLSFAENADEELVATKFRYVNSEGKIVETDDRMLPKKTAYALPDAMPGKYFEFASGFLPENGRDTAWMNWTKASTPIRYEMDNSKWTATVTDGRLVSGTTDKWFDINLNTYCSFRNTAPVIIAIDTHEEPDHLMTLQSLTFHIAGPNYTYRAARTLSMFIGDTPFDPNDANWQTNFGTPWINNTTFWNGDGTPNRGGAYTSGRYLAIVVSSFYARREARWLDVRPWGYIAAEANME